MVDVKLDGIRIQVHRSGDDIAVFTRSLDEITARVPEVVAAVRALPARELVLDGEAIGAGRGRPAPAVPGDVQRAATRGARRRVTHRAAAAPVAPAVLAAAGTSGTTVLTPYFFDLLHLDGTDLLDAPGRERWAALAGTVDPAAAGRRGRRSTTSRAAAAAFAAALDAGQEGIVVKAPDAPYDVGRRGRGVGQGQAAAHPRPGRARRRVGQRTTQRLAVEPAPGRP